MKTITKSSIVKYKDGWYRVSALFSKTVNLCGIFNTDKIYYKGVSIDEVIEDEDNWYKNWQQSETYKCM